ncbi:MAG: L-aspartate oxidase [Planctomycetales bacterium]|nr:L-aspartate oxidase [Planctomycetales bacterium]
MAGLRAALEAARTAEVLLVTKGPLGGGATLHAQGGIACAMGPDDSPELHAADTVNAGQGLTDPPVARLVAGEARERIEELLGWGARLDRAPDGSLALGREGGHSRARILHANGDATGAEVSRVLVSAVKALPAHRVRVLEKAYVVDLLTEGGRCLGVLADLGPAGGRQAIWAGATVLATGGAGRLYRETTNPAGATGDGLGIAHRAGAAARDLEFVQFHPTTLYVAGAPRALVTEAIRGYGAYLRDRTGRRFMPDVHPDAELAPRDVVSRAILARMRALGDVCVFVDLRHMPPEEVRARFPTVRDACATVGLDLARDLIPVRPTAHYAIGGLTCDLAGASTLPGLLVAGEVASTGLHGANRLGSNSLLEGMVFGRRAGAAAAAEATRAGGPRVGRVRAAGGGSPAAVDVADVQNSVRALLGRDIGIERDAEGLRRAAEQIAFWQGYVLPAEFPDPAGLTLQNMLTVAGGIVAGALAREETRGVHYRTDFPTRDDARFARHLEWPGLDG